MAAFAQAGVDTATARLRLLVLQPTPFCNIDCAYCYLSNRRSTARMSLETLDLACRRVFESPFLDRLLQVAWHGGEPLVVPLAWYEDAVALMAERRPATLCLRIASRPTDCCSTRIGSAFLPERARASGSVSTARPTCTTPTGVPAAGAARTKARCAPCACCRSRMSHSTSSRCSQNAPSTIRTGS